MIYEVRWEKQSDSDETYWHAKQLKTKLRRQRHNQNNITGDNILRGYAEKGELFQTSKF